MLWVWWNVRHKSWSAEYLSILYFETLPTSDKYIWTTSIHFLYRLPTENPRVSCSISKVWMLCSSWRHGTLYRMWRMRWSSDCEAIIVDWESDADSSSNFNFNDWSITVVDTWKQCSFYGLKWVNLPNPTRKIPTQVHLRTTLCSALAILGCS